MQKTRCKSEDLQSCTGCPDKGVCIKHGAKRNIAVKTDAPIMQRKDIFVSGIAKIKRCSHEGCTKVVTRVTEEIVEDVQGQREREEWRSLYQHFQKKKIAALRRDVPVTIKRKTCIYAG